MSNAAAAADTPPPAPRPRGKKRLIIIVVAAAVLLLGGGGGAAIVVLKKKAVADGDGADETAQVDEAPAKAKADSKRAPVFAPLDPFTVNLTDRETERYAQVALTLELSDATTADQVKTFMPAIRNNILMVLAHKSSTQILGAEGKTKLAGEIQRATSRALGVAVEEPETETDITPDAPKKNKKKKKAEIPLPVVAVHFSNFIVQ